MKLNVTSVGVTLEPHDRMVVGLQSVLCRNSVGGNWITQMGGFGRWNSVLIDSVVLCQCGAADVLGEC